MEKSNSENIAETIAVNAFLEELKDMFDVDSLYDAFFDDTKGNFEANSTEKNGAIRINLSSNYNGKPRSKDYDACAYFDWGKDMFSKGAYSYPTTGCGWYKNITKSNEENQPFRTMRDDLADPVANSVFFAGEHTSTISSGYVQSALETGIRAGKEVANSILS